MGTNRMDSIKMTNRLLLVIVIPLIFFLLQVLKFIFLPLIASMFIVILFMPMMRWLKKRKIPKIFGVFAALLIMIIGIKVAVELVKVASQEVRNADMELMVKIDEKVSFLLGPITDMLGWERPEEDNLSGYLHLEELTEPLSQYFGSAVQFIRNSTSLILMTLFFLLLLLAGAVDIQKIMEQTLFKKKRVSVVTLTKIEKGFIKFIKVKFIISLATGICFGLACYLFGVSFPFLWGLAAFILNFIQVVGSIVTTIALTLFAIAEMDPSGTLLVFIIVIVGLQILFGSILEPIFMGHSFRINIITILVMLMLWGFIWGVSGIILAVPITVLIKTILEKFPESKKIAQLMS